jgi:hypothetical protein
MKNENQARDRAIERPDKQVVACNYSADTNACARGALCYVILLHIEGRDSRILILERAHEAGDGSRNGKAAAGREIFGSRRSLGDILGSWILVFRFPGWIVW